MYVVVNNDTHHNQTCLPEKFREDGILDTAFRQAEERAAITLGEASFTISQNSKHQNEQKPYIFPTTCPLPVVLRIK